MADITLKAYIAHVDDLLSRRQYEQAEAHCKHILAKYPKNLAILRRLAKSQFEGGRYAESESTYATVLSMEPRASDAYVGLSWVARQRGHGDQTIALLERAYEQDPNNQDVIQLLRDAHRTFNDRANARLPQTQYIAARQQWRSGLNQQAISTLNAALAADPARADMRILKMQIHLQSGDGIEAARAATDLLKQLPDCVEANRMLAEFWKAQGRSSDAQRFVSRVESSDPFLAFEIATGSPPADEALMLDLMDVRAAPVRSVTDAPDWLGQLGTAEPTETAMPKVEKETIDWLSRAEPVLEDNDTADKSWLADATQVADMPADLSWLADAASEQVSGDTDSEEYDFGATFGTVEENAPLPNLNMDWMEEAEAADEGDTLDSISTKMANEEVTSAKVIDELSAMAAGDEPAPEALAAEPGAEEWMNAITADSTDQTTPDREEFDDFLKNFTNFSDLSPEPAAQSSGTGLTGLLGGLSTTEETPEALNPDIADIDPEDPLAWMRAGINESGDLGNDLDFAAMQEDAMPDLDALLGGDSFANEPAAEPAQAVDAADDPFAWMHDHDIEYVASDAPKEASLWDDPMGVAEMRTLDEAEADPLAWMERAGVNMDEDEEVDPEADPLAWAKESGLDLLEDVGQANFKPTAALSADMAQFGAELSQEPSPFDELSSSQPPVPGKSGLLAFVKDDDAAQGGDSPMTDNQLPDWLSGPDDEDETPKAEDSGELADFDWMAVTPSESEADIDWDAAPETAAADETAPEWLASLDNPVDAAEAAALSAKDDPSINVWDDAVDDAAVDAPDWMKALRDESPAAQEAVSGAEDWVFSEGEAASGEIEGAKDDLLASVMPTEGEAVDEFADWLSAAAPAEAVSGAAESVEAAADDAMDWLSAAVPAEAVSGAAESVEAAADDAMDWLSAAAPEEAVSGAAESVEAAADDAMDWLSAAAPAEAVSGAAESVEAAADDAMDWLSAAAPEEAMSGAAESVEAAADDAMDWLSAAAPAEAVSGAAESVEAAADDAMDWLGGVTHDEKPAAAVEEPSMDWLEAELEEVGDQTNAFVAQDSLDWLTGGAAADASAEDDAAARAVSPEFMGQSSEEAPELSTDFDFGGDHAAADLFAAASDDVDSADIDAPSYDLSFLEDDESTEDVATVELEGDPLPDWLMESRSDAPAVKMDVDVPESQLQAQGELSGEILDDADLLEPEAPVEETLSPSAVNSPDWLNAMVPGLEIGSDGAEEAEDLGGESDFFNGGRSDFNWLNSLVDEELAPPAMAAPSRRSARFPFSELPNWLAMLKEETQGASPVADFDVEDDSLPDWLKFDDAETN
ncbi:MAG: tetratricopeptide repeat protein [Chloroflexi bacterium]|nr:tetratricopeptide repeat protein [Chloroflexota bacterium]